MFSQPRRAALRVAEYLGCPTEDMHDLAACVRAADADDLMKAMNNQTVKDSGRN